MVPTSFWQGSLAAQRCERALVAMVGNTSTESCCRLVLKPSKLSQVRRFGGLQGLEEWALCEVSIEHARGVMDFIDTVASNSDVKQRCNLLGHVHRRLIGPFCFGPLT